MTVFILVDAQSKVREVSVWLCLVRGLALSRATLEVPGSRSCCTPLPQLHGPPDLFHPRLPLCFQTGDLTEAARRTSLQCRAEPVSRQPDANPMCTEFGGLSAASPPQTGCEGWAQGEQEPSVRPDAAQPPWGPTWGPARCRCLLLPFLPLRTPGRGDGRSPHCSLSRSGARAWSRAAFGVLEEEAGSPLASRCPACCVSARGTRRVPVTSPTSGRQRREAAAWGQNVTEVWL